MVFLWILLGLILFIALLCAIPLRLRIRLDEQFSLLAGIGPLVLFRTPKPFRPVDLRDFTYRKHRKRLQKEQQAKLKKKQKKKRLEDKKQQKKNTAAAKVGEIEKTAAEAGKKENKLEGILSLVSCVLDGLPGLFGGFKCRIFLLDVTAGGKEAADTARNFAILSQSLAYLLEFLDNKTHFVRPRENTVAIRADFLLAKTRVKADFYLQIRIGQILGTVIGIAFSYIKTMIRVS
ncbi:MAG: hypothetical protein E7631_01115 [Ruminococcaceae bacterium]|nr:hypothetical protein [Oscillospiraceae bacterium]